MFIILCLNREKTQILLMLEKYVLEHMMLFYLTPYYQNVKNLKKMSIIMVHKCGVTYL